MLDTMTETQIERLESVLAELRALDKWISKEAAAERLGVTEDTLRGYQDRFWERGVHYQVIGRTTYVNYGRVQEWISSLGDSRERATESASASISTGEKHMTKRYSATRIPQLS